MSKVSIEESTLSAIGNAIRKKTGESALLSPLDMPTAIGSISGGGGGGDNEDSPFIYTKTEKQIEKEIRARLGYPAPPPLQFEGEVMIVQFSKLGEYLKIPKCWTPADGSPLAYAAEIYGVNNGQWEMFAHYDRSEGDNTYGVYDKNRKDCVNIEGAFTTLETYEGYILVRGWGKSSDNAMLATDYNSYNRWRNIVELKEYFYTTTPRGYTEYWTNMDDGNYSLYWPNHLEIVTYKGGNDYDHALNTNFDNDFCFGMAKLIKTENESGKIYVKQGNGVLVQPCTLVGKRSLLSTPNFYLYNINNNNSGTLSTFFSKIHRDKDGGDAKTLRSFYYAPRGTDSSDTSDFSNNPAANRYTHIQVPITGLLPYSGTQSKIWLGGPSCNNSADIEFVMDDKLYDYFKKNPNYNGCYTLYCLCGTTWDVRGMNYINVPMCYLNNFSSAKQITIQYAEGFTFDKRPGLSHDASVNMNYRFLNSHLDYDKFVKSLPTDISAFGSVTLTFDGYMYDFLSKEQKEYITSLGYNLATV